MICEYKSLESLSACENDDIHVIHLIVFFLLKCHKFRDPTSHPINT